MGLVSRRVPALLANVSQDGLACCAISRDAIVIAMAEECVSKESAYVEKAGLARPAETGDARMIALVWVIAFQGNAAARQVMKGKTARR
jgi:hypothetical protein